MAVVSIVGEQQDRREHQALSSERVDVLRKGLVVRHAAVERAKERACIAFAERGCQGAEQVHNVLPRIGREPRGHTAEK